MKYLTISIAAYNAEKWLEMCLNSFVIPEILEDIEVLIVNDGSTDSTAEIAEKYVTQYPNAFVLINKENGGHGSTINAGIKAASGLYFKLVDADDWVENDGLLDLINVIKEHTADAFISPYYKCFEKTGEKILVNSPRMQKLVGKEQNVESLYKLYEFTLPSLTFRTDILKSHFTGIDEKCFYVDNEYVCFYINYVQNVILTGVPVYDYRIGTNEQSININNTIKRLDHQLKVINRLIDFYLEESHSKIVQSFVMDCILYRYRTLISIPEASTSKKEFIRFESFMFSKSNELYFQAISNGIKDKKETAMFVHVMRKVKYKGYALLHFFAKSKVK